MRTCKKCGYEKPLTSFAKAKRCTGGRSWTCHRCKDGKVPQAYGTRATPAGKSDDFEITVDMPPAERARTEHAAEVARRDLRAEHAALLEENETLRARLQFKARLDEPAVLTPMSRPVVTKGEAVACAVFSDWHVEESVEAVNLHGLNEYNLEIARERAKHAFQNLLALEMMMAKEVQIDTLLLMLDGDFFTNYLHEENQQTNLLAPSEAAKFAQDLLTSGIRFLLKESSCRIILPCVPGNHGRMTKKMQIQNATGTSVETFMYHTLANRFEDNPRVEFRVATSKMLYVPLFEKFKIRLIHGDDIKYNGGVGGFTIPIKKKIAAWDKAIRADLTVLGHYHQLFDGGDFLVNGSLIGFNEFAQAIGASPEEPRQAFFLVDARNGGQKSITAPVWLDAKHKERGS